MHNAYNRQIFNIGLSLAAAASSVGVTGYLGLKIYQLLRLEFALQKELLHQPITIQPRESVEKLFWLKNPKDQIEIDFEAVKVLK